MKGIKTNIPGFDALVEGSIPHNKILLLSGTPGTGKSIFGMQFIYNGAKDFKEKGMYISFEEDADNIRAQAKQFGWDLAKLEKKKLIKIVSITPKSLNESTLETLFKQLREQNYSRLVVDSLSALSINIPTTTVPSTDITELSIKRFMYYFINDIRSIPGLTSFLISQTTDGQLSRDTVSEFICDGIIHITYASIGGAYSRSLSVRKMRERKNDEDIHPIEIGKKGMVVHTIG